MQLIYERLSIVIIDFDKLMEMNWWMLVGNDANVDENDANARNDSNDANVENYVDAKNDSNDANVENDADAWNDLMMQT